MPIKLNLGCGTDRRPDFINIDGSPDVKPDLVIDLTNPKSYGYFPLDYVDQILAQDIIEHLHRWEAVDLLKACYHWLKPHGELEIRVPDCEAIINSSTMRLEHKLTMLYGGQDEPQGVSKAMDASRAKHPEFFCHRYGWTIARMREVLRKIGFTQIICTRQGVNFHTIARK